MCTTASLIFFCYASVGAYEHYQMGYRIPKLEIQEVQRIKAKNAAKYENEYGEKYDRTVSNSDSPNASSGSKTIVLQ